MRISEDDTSWKAGGIVRRDFRNDRGVEDTPRHKKKKKRTKNSKFECGRGGWHKVIYKKIYNYSDFAYPHCSKCGKRLPLNSKTLAKLGDDVALNKLTCPHNNVYTPPSFPQQRVCNHCNLSWYEGRY